MHINGGNWVCIDYKKKICSFFQVSKRFSRNEIYKALPVKLKSYLNLTFNQGHFKTIVKTAQKIIFFRIFQIFLSLKNKLLHENCNLQISQQKCDPIIQIFILQVRYFYWLVKQCCFSSAFQHFFCNFVMIILSFSCYLRFDFT